MTPIAWAFIALVQGMVAFVLPFETERQCEAYRAVFTRASSQGGECAPMMSNPAGPKAPRPKGKPL